MGRVFAILAFMTVMGLIVPFLNTNSPFATSSQIQVNNPLGASVYQKAVGVNVNGGTVKANASIGAGSTGGSTSAFGSLITGTLLVFGNFYAAVQYLASLAVGVMLPYRYVYAWLAWSNAPAVTNTAALIAGMVNVLVWVAYANEIIFLISGRWIFSP